MRHLPKSDFRSMPWKNGGGQTIEIIKSPEGADLNHFDWRISMAVVASDGPFSIFPEIDRHLAVLEGAGIDLHVGDNGPSVHLTPASQAFAFAGDRPITATLTDGPITDLNVMVRRGVWQAELSSHEFAGNRSFALSGDFVLFLVQQGSLSCVVHDQRCNACEGDAVVFAPSDASVLCEAATHCRIWQIKLTRVTKE